MYHLGTIFKKKVAKEIMAPERPTLLNLDQYLNKKINKQYNEHQPRHDDSALNICCSNCRSKLGRGFLICNKNEGGHVMNSPPNLRCSRLTYSFYYVVVLYKKHS